MKFKVSYDGILPKSVMLDEVGYVRDDVVNQFRAEITKLRAELAEANGRIALRDGECRSKGQIISDLERDLAAERELADRMKRALEESRNWNWIDFEDDRDDGVDVESFLPHLVKLDREISEILTAHVTRRNK